jgi:hypothetical protein
MRTAFVRMESGVLHAMIGERMFGLYALGIELLLQTQLAISCDLPLSNALSAVAEAKSRGADMAWIEGDLLALNDYFERNRLQLLFRLGGTDWGPD